MTHKGTSLVRPTDPDPSYAERHGLDLGVEHRVPNPLVRTLLGYVPFSQMSILPGWEHPGPKTARWQKWEVG